MGTARSVIIIITKMAHESNCLAINKGAKDLTHCTCAMPVFRY